MPNLELYRQYLAYMANPKKAWKQVKWNAELRGSFEEIFINQEYDWLARQIKPGTTVIDIGANIGDTPIYFAMMPNVKKVIAYEPNPATFEMAKGLIKRNPYRNKITLVNKAISDQRGTRRARVANVGDKMFSYQDHNDDSGVRMSSITLNEALKGVKNVVIKSDCEGGEKTLFNHADLSQVYALMVEYHNCKAEVMAALKKGYKLKTRSINATQGYVCAEKRKWRSK